MNVSSRLRSLSLVLAMPLAMAACANADKTASIPQPLPKEKVRELVRKEAKAQGVPTSLALAVAQVESGFNPLAKSPVGAMGVMQVMPATARLLGYSGPDIALLDATVNVPLGVKYLKEGLDEGGPRWAVARYHGGPNTRLHGPKTAKYTRTVLAFYKRGFDEPFPGQTDDKGYLTNTQVAMLDTPLR
ncbi:transglycosylase SLT domain-containing protein [Nostoc sp. NIES-2111]